MKCRSRSLWKGTGVAVVLLQAQWRALDCTTRPVGEIHSFDSSLPLGYADMAVLLTSQVDEATMAPHDGDGPFCWPQFRSEGYSGDRGYGTMH